MACFNIFHYIKRFNILLKFILLPENMKFHYQSRITCFLVINICGNLEIFVWIYTMRMHTIDETLKKQRETWLTVREDQLGKS